MDPLADAVCCAAKWLKSSSTHSCEKGHEEGLGLHISGLRPYVRAPYGKPYLRTVNFQLLGWLPLLEFWSWSSRLPAKSCAPVVTVAL